MTETKFVREMRRARAMARTTTEPNQAQYWEGYQRGLRRARFGERFGTAREHAAWLALADEAVDMGRQARGRGYQEGLTFEEDEQH